MKKLLLLTAIAALTLNSMTVSAAPKTMKDGTVFDAAFYAENYPDVKAAIGTDENALYEHYKKYGKAEGRLAVASSGTQTPQGQKGLQDNFDAAYYAASNPDVVAALGKDAKVLYQHYLKHGKAEGRKPNAGSNSANTPAPAAPSTPASSSAPANGAVTIDADADHLYVTMPALDTPGKKFPMRPYAVKSPSGKAYVTLQVSNAKAGENIVFWYGGGGSGLQAKVENGTAFSLVETDINVGRTDSQGGFYSQYSPGMKVPASAYTAVAARYEGNSQIPTAVSVMDFAVEFK